MPYYTGDYYRGDNYAGDYYRGDSIFKKIAKGVAKVGGALLGATPVGAVVKSLVPVRNVGGLPAVGGTRDRLARRFLGQIPELPEPGERYSPWAGAGRRRRSMNVLNPKALTRATRRLCGFRTKATSALRELGYTVARTGTAKRCSCKGAGCKKCG